MQTASAAFGACSGGGAGAGSCSSFDGRRVGVGTVVATGISSARFSNRRISECSVAASLLLEFPSARFSNRRISECSVAASEIGALILLRIAGVVALADEPAGLQHSSLHSSLIFVELDLCQTLQNL